MAAAGSMKQCQTISITILVGHTIQYKGLTIALSLVPSQSVSLTAYVTFELPG